VASSSISASVSGGAHFRLLSLDFGLYSLKSELGDDGWLPGRVSIRGMRSSLYKVGRDGIGGSEGGSWDVIGSRGCHFWCIGIEGEVAIGISGPCEGSGGVDVGGQLPAASASATCGRLVIGRGRGRGRGGGAGAEVGEVTLGVYCISLRFVGSFPFGFAFGLGLGFDFDFVGLKLNSSSSSSEVSSITSDLNWGEDFWMRCRVLALSAIVPGMGSKSVNMLVIEVSAALAAGEVKRVG